MADDTVTGAPEGEQPIEFKSRRVKSDAPTEQAPQAEQAPQVEAPQVEAPKAVASSHIEIFSDAESTAKKLKASPVAGTEKSTALLKEFDDKRTALQAALEGDEHAKSLHDAFSNAKAGVATLESEIKVDGKLKEGLDPAIVKSTEEKIAAAKTTATEAQKNMQTYLQGKAEKKPADALKTAYTEAEKAAGKVQGVNSAIFGRMRTEGVGGALKHNFGIAEGASKGRIGKIAMRGGGVVVGGWMTVDAFRSKNKDGSDRSFVGRLGEAAAGLALAGGSALGGRARI